MTTAQDLVPVSVLMGIAQRVRTKAAEIARSKNVPIKTANEIGILTPRVTQNQTEIDLTLGNALKAYEWGSGEHRKRGTPAKYPITPNTARAIWFPYPESKIYPGAMKYVKDGVVGITTDIVMHPGVEARPFLEPAKRQTRKENLEDIRRTNLANTRLIIKGMARKV
jgi:hypothetical protein